MPRRRSSSRMGNSWVSAGFASKWPAVIGGPDRAVGQDGVLARVGVVAPLRDALVVFPKRAGGEELRMQDRDASGDPGDVDACGPQARREALEEALRIGDPE